MNPAKKFCIYNTLMVAAMILGAFGAFSAFAADPEAAGAAVKELSQAQAIQNAAIYIAIGITMTGACLAAGLAVARVGSAALGAVSEKPEMMGKSLIFVGLAEGIAIYGLLVGVLLLNKIS
jgi:V/A-type H+-transporting ATPase subunit K